MEAILQLQESNCKDCYKCIRACPVKSIRFSDHEANIIADECILCGRCFVVCPQNAKKVRNDIPAARRLLQSGRPVVASMAPSFIADFGVSGIEELRPALERLGFAWAEETAIGAQIVKKEYERMVEAGQDVIISSCCHSVNSLIQKYYPQALPYLAHCLSPMLAHAKLVKEQNPEALVVFIGPCLSKKEEQEKYGIVDCVLTFDELRLWLEEEGVDLPQSHPLDGTGHRARFFPTTGGIIKSMDLGDYTYLAVDGVESCIEAIQEIEAGNLHRCFIEMSACKGSCIGGPAMARYHESPMRSTSRVYGYAGGQQPGFAEPGRIELKKQMDYIGVSARRPGEEEIYATLIKMGKPRPELELNCGTCGYNTCREKAIAILEGKAEVSMCLPFLKEKAESFSDTIINNTPNAIIVMDEDLNIQQINRAACQLFHLSSPKEMKGTPVTSLLSPVDYIRAMDGEMLPTVKKNYIAEYDKYVEESIVYNKDYNIVISIMKDITEQEMESQQRAETQMKAAEITDKVIEKQMRVVQEIASLLGETTAETKIALTKLKETI